MKPTSQKVTFKGAFDDDISASLELPAGEPTGFALFAHCFTCTKETVAASRISKALTEFGIGVLRFDFTGLGGSEGDFASTNFSSNIADLLKAVEYLRDNYQAPKLMIGHSLGGTATLAAATKVPEVEAVASIGSPANPEHVAHLFAGSVDEIEAKGVTEVKIGGRKFSIQKQFLDDIRANNLLDDLPTLKAALLVFHSPQDTIVSIDNARLIYEAAKHPKSFISLDKADHLLTRKADAFYVANVLAAWASRYINDASVEVQKPDMPSLAEGEVSVSETRTGKFTQNIVTYSHHLLADEPLGIGDDKGPSPYELVLAGLGACTSMTMRMYADHKGIPLDKASVILKHKKIHAADCDSCESNDGKLDHIERIVHVEGDLTDEQRDKLLAIANKCPVHKTLTSEIVVSTVLDEK